MEGNATYGSMSAHAAAALPTEPRWSPKQRTMMLALLLLGVAVRVLFFAVDRPLWIDEAMLAANLVERDYAGLREPLIYGQVAPIGYLYVERFLMDAFGSGEKVMRSVSLLAGLLCLPVFAGIAGRLLTPAAALIAMLLFSVSEPMVYYSVELKPYSVDVLAALLIFWAALRIMQDGWRTLDLILFGVTGIIGLFFSFTLVFMIAVLGLCLMLAALGRSDRRSAIIVAILCIACAGLFLLLKHHFMKESESVDHHRGFWTAKRAFMPLPPKSLDDLTWFILKPLDFFVDPMRYKAFGLAAMLIAAGAAAIWKKDRLLVVMLAAPVPLIVLLSATKMYPFGVQSELRHPILGRVMLFVVPFFLLLMARGLLMVRTSAGRWGLPALGGVLLVLLAHPSLMLLGYIRNPDEPHDIRPALNMLKAQVQPGDRIFMNWGGMMVANYYWDRHGLSETKRFGVTGAGGGGLFIGIPKFEEFERTFAEQEGGRIWVMYVHSPDLADHRTDEKFLRWYLPTIATRQQIQGIDSKPAEFVSVRNVTLHLYTLPPLAQRKTPLKPAE